MEVVIELIFVLIIMFNAGFLLNNMGWSLLFRLQEQEVSTPSSRLFPPV